MSHMQRSSAGTPKVIFENSGSWLIDNMISMRPGTDHTWVVDTEDQSDKRTPLLHPQLELCDPSQPDNPQHTVG